MNLVLGYNGFARVLGKNHMGFGPPQNIIGQSAGAQLRIGGRGGFGMFGNQSQGWSRLFGGEFGFEIGWLLPAALLATVLVVLSRGRAPRTDLVRAGAILFGGWLIVDGLVLSFMHGSIHPYYCLSIAPPWPRLWSGRWPALRRMPLRRSANRTRVADRPSAPPTPPGRTTSGGRTTTAPTWTRS
jgi:hypothetical protein